MKNRILLPLAPLTAALALALSGMAGCSTNPTTGRLQYGSVADDASLGTEAAPQLTEEFGGKVPSPELQAYITEVGKALAAKTEGDAPSLPWEFTLLNSPVINAFALPGGKVFISRGLADKLTNEAQLAAVLGHECGHVTARHSNSRMIQQAILVGGGQIVGSVAGGVLGDADAGAQAGQSLGSVVTLSYSRDQEVEADRLGMRYMKELMYDPMGAIEVQEILKAESGGSSQPEILSTHPASDTRIAELHKRFEKYHTDTVNNPAYQKFPDRYQQRYLNIAKKLPPAPTPPPTPAPAAATPAAAPASTPK